MNATDFDGKLALQQRVLTAYRAPFFDTLAQACAGGLSVCAGLPRPEESIAVTDQMHGAEFTSVQNMHLFQDRYYLCYQRGLIAWLKDRSPDALIVEANPRYLATPAAVQWMRRRGKPVIGWGLGAPAPSGPLSGLRQARRLSFLRPFDALITYSRRGADEYAMLGFPADKIFVAPNAASARPSLPMPSRPVEFHGKAVVLFVGRLQAEFPGAKQGTELAGYFSSSDLFVLPGTGGLAVQEAMSYGLPVIMGQGDGTNDQLVRTGNGWQILPDDIYALTGSLHSALSDARRLRRMGAESYRIVRDEINLEQMVRVFVEALNSVKAK